MDAIAWGILGVLLLISSVFLLTKLYRTSQRLPPGPLGLPLLGCPWALKYDFHILFADLAKTYGDVVSVNIMGKTVIALNSAEAVREAFNSPDTGEIFAGRGPPPDGNDVVQYMASFIQPGPIWTKQRKLVHKILNHYGEGIRESEIRIQDELAHVIEWLEAAKFPVNLDDIIYPSLINILTILLKGRRYDYNSCILDNVRVFDDVGVQTSSAALTTLVVLLPFIKYIPVGPGKFRRKILKAAEQFHKDYFEETKATFDPNVSRGMIDFLLRHQEESRLQDGSSWLHDDIIKATIQEMMTAGIMTTRGALYAFFLIIAHKPEVARKIQVEIEAVTGGSRSPKLADRGKMPYTMATMFELLRYISHVPVGLMHKVTDDVTFHGYFMPKNTTVIYNSWCFHHDEKTFPDPWEFQPERFLDADGQLVPGEHRNRKNSMPFGTGRRSCVGEAFAKSRMFLFVTTLLQRFNFTEDPAIPLVSCDPRTYRPGLVLSPYSYFLKVTARG